MRRNFTTVCIVVAAALLAACSGGGSSPGSGAGFSFGGGGAADGKGGGGGAPGPTAAPTIGLAPLVPAANSIYLGAFVNPGGGGSDTANIAQFESQIGRRLALSLHYRGWTKPFPTADEVADAKAGRIPVISWECGTTDANVASGTEDANIIAHADAMRAYGHPAFLRYKWEFNLPGAVNGRTYCANPAHDSSGGFFSPTDFIAAWNHIRAIFSARGATNVAFLWNPSGGSAMPPHAFYPGDASVDWIGIDEYDRNNASFLDTYDVYGQVAGYRKPIIIAETGANPAYQPTFLAAAVPTLQTAFPEVKGFIYFDAPGNFSWTLTPAGLAAFAAMGREPYVSAP